MNSYFIGAGPKVLVIPDHLQEKEVKEIKNNFEKFARENAKPDCLKACSEPDTIELLTAAARSKEILVNVPKLKTEKVENEMDITKTTTEQLVEELARRDANKTLHRNHPFYQRAQHYREIERWGQIEKGAEKYPTPFNPDEWTPRQLIQHAMQENVDQAHYMYGMYEKIEAMECELEKYKSGYESYKEQLHDVGRLTRFLVEFFPEDGNAGDLSVDVAIELLKQYHNKHIAFNEQRRQNAEMLTDLNALAKYMIVHFPNWCIEGEKTTATAKKVLDAFRMADNFNAKG